MLRLNSCRPLIPSPQKLKTSSGCSSWIVHYNRSEILSARITIRALKDETNGGTSESTGRSWDPGLEFEVPYEQRPQSTERQVNEYSSLRDAALYSWAELDPASFLLRLGGLWLVTFTVLGVPIAAASFNPSKVKPVIKLLKQTLVGTGALLVAAVILFTFATPVEDFFKSTFATKENSSNLSASKISTKNNMRKVELLKLPVEVMADDDLAAAAAEAADGRPVYCRDRYYRALAGGQ